MDFYAEKGNQLPRHIYRQLFDALAQSNDVAARDKMIAAFCEFLDKVQLTGDLLKLKWCLPPRADVDLSEAEKQQIENALAKKRHRRNDKLVEVYPHCADEFSTRIEFLDAAFGSQRFGLFDKQTKLFTIGSCFARNIANFLDAQGYVVSPFVQAEDLNSPFSNAKMLVLAAAEESVRHAYIAYWVEAIYPPEKAPHFPKIIKMEMERLLHLREALKVSEFLIVTCGNVLDYFLSGPVGAFDIGPNVAPKFLSVSSSEDVSIRTYLTQKMKESGAQFRLGSYAEVTVAMESLYTAIRAINPDAHLLFTLSPVPIDSAVGASGARKQGAMEIDCASKSMLRVALHEMFQSKAGDAKLHYFPSFEIVRWVGAGIDSAIFGKQDAASRHVSQDILSGVYRYFLHKYGS